MDEEKETNKKRTIIVNTPNMSKEIGWFEAPQQYEMKDTELEGQETDRTRLEQLTTKKSENEEEAIKRIELLYRQRKNSGLFAFAEHITIHHHLITAEDNETIYRYDEGIYKEDGNKFIEKKASYFFVDQINNRDVEEIKGYVRRSTYRPREEIDLNNQKYLCVNNGYINLLTGEIKPHTHKIIFLNKIPINYDEEATCPAINKFLSEIIETEEERKLIIEFSGFCMYRDYIFHKAIMLVGEGSNGKSTFLELLKLFIGEKNITTISLQRLEEDRFALSGLYGKMVNIFSDLSSKALQETSNFKMAVGHDTLFGEQKFKNGFSFVNYAKFIFSANRLPESPDDSNAFFRRWEIVTFPRTFTEDNKDPHLIKKITTDAELSGFLNLALGGLKDLLERGRFNNESTIDVIRDKYMRMSDTVASFIMDHIESSTEDYVVKELLFSNYIVYCDIHRLPKVSEKKFFINFKKKMMIEEFRTGKIEGHKRAFRGMKLNELISKKSDKLDKVVTPLLVVEKKPGSLNTIQDIHDSLYCKVINDNRGGKGKIMDILDKVDSNKNLYNHIKKGINKKEQLKKIGFTKEQLNKAKEKGLIYETKKDEYETVQ